MHAVDLGFNLHRLRCECRRESHRPLHQARRNFQCESEKRAADYALNDVLHQRVEPVPERAKSQRFIGLVVVHGDDVLGVRIPHQHHAVMTVNDCLQLTEHLADRDFLGRAFDVGGGRTRQGHRINETKRAERDSSERHVWVVVADLDDVAFGVHHCHTHYRVGKRLHVHSGTMAPGRDHPRDGELGGDCRALHTKASSLGDNG